MGLDRGDRLSILPQGEARRAFCEERQQVCRIGTIDHGGGNRARSLVDDQQPDRDRSPMAGEGLLKPGVEHNAYPMEHPLEHVRLATLGLEAIRHDGNEAAVGPQGTERRSQMACSSDRVLLTGRIAGERRVHQHHARTLFQMGADAGRVVAGYGSIWK